ncbi:MAG TPA: cell division protein FtsL [bacterium]|nr:cell division protein FtsL [bacterium]
MDLKLVRRLPAALGSASYVVLVVLCAVVLTVGAVFFLWQRYQFVRLGYQVDRLRTEQSRLREAIEPLEVEVQYLSRLKRIDELARTQLHMHDPDPSQVIVLESDVPAAQSSR